MSTNKPTGPAQPNGLEQKQDDKKPAAGADQRQGKASKDDEPGADGFRTAGASEDTYD